MHVLFIRRNLEEYIDANVWINDKKVYSWTYCQTWDPDFDCYIDDNFEPDIIAHYGDYRFYSSLIKE